jgi:hypothetical protein
VGGVRDSGRARAATTAQFTALFGSAAAIVIAGVLLATDVLQVGTGRDGHALISALPLACIAVAFLLHQPVRRPTRGQAVKAGLLSAAFLLWAAYQLQPSLPVFVNDLAITLFVFDVALALHRRTPPRGAQRIGLAAFSGGFRPAFVRSMSASQPSSGTSRSCHPSCSSAKSALIELHGFPDRAQWAEKTTFHHATCPTELRTDPFRRWLAPARSALHPRSSH